MATLPVQFRKSPESVVTYNYTDFASGTGIETFKCMAIQTSGAVTFILSSQNQYSARIETSGAITQTSYSNCNDIDFDLTAFNTSRTIKGTGYVNCVSYLNQTGGVAVSAYVTATVRKWDGTSETDIAFGQSKVHDPGAGTLKNILTIPIVIPETYFKPGEVLRLNLTTWASKTAGGTGTNILAHDPLNRDGDFIKPTTDVNPGTFTNTAFYCPFKIDN